MNWIEWNGKNLLVDGNEYRKWLESHGVDPKVIRRLVGETGPAKPSANPETGAALKRIMEGV